MDLVSDEIKPEILRIWDKYISDNKIVLDVKGIPIENIDKKRVEAIVILKKIIQDFVDGKLPTGEFKTSIDSFNKQNNLWGFTSIKGQMFFNILLKSNSEDAQIKFLTALLRRSIVAPSEVNDALSKIEALEVFCNKAFLSASDKRKVANPSSIGYFLSYFWQIQDYEKWPLMYSSMIEAWRDIGLWKESSDQKNAYHLFYMLNHFIKEIISKHAKHVIINWDIEHAFWNYKGNVGHSKTAKRNLEVEAIIKPKETPISNNTEVTKPLLNTVEVTKPLYKANFEINDYLIPKVARLIELGSQTEKSAATKGSEYEKLVSEIFKQLDFEVQFLGQGSGRNPDAIIKFREENTAFLVDAKAYSSGYSLGVDDRAIKEYISHHCPKLQKEGYKKIGFIIVSNSFKSNFDTFMNEITWSTDIKRFVLMTSEALLYLLAYKTKDKLSLSAIIESIVGFGNLVTAQNVIEKFDDV